MRKWKRTQQEYLDLGACYASDVVLAAHRARRVESRHTLRQLLDIAICLGRLTTNREEVEQLLAELMAFTKDDIR